MYTDGQVVTKDENLFNVKGENKDIYRCNKSPKVDLHLRTDGMTIKDIHTCLLFINAFVFSCADYYQYSVTRYIIGEKT